MSELSARERENKMDGEAGSIGGHLKGHLREYGMLLALVLIMAFF